MATPPPPPPSSPGKKPTQPVSSAMANPPHHPTTPRPEQSVFGPSTTSSAAVRPPLFFPYFPPKMNRAGKGFDSPIFPGSASPAAVHPLQELSAMSPVSSSDTEQPLTFNSTQMQSTSNFSTDRSLGLINPKPLVIKSTSAASFFCDTAASNGTSSHHQMGDPLVETTIRNQWRDRSQNQERNAPNEQGPRPPVTSRYFDAVASFVGSIPGVAIFAVPLAAIVLNSNMQSLYGECISFNALATGFIITIVMACAIFVGNYLAGHSLVSYGRATGKEDGVFDVQKNRRIFMFFLCALFLAITLLMIGFILSVQIVFGTGFCHLPGGFFTIASIISIAAAFAPGLYGIYYLMRSNAGQRR